MHTYVILPTITRGLCFYLIFFLSHLERQFDVSTSIVHTFYCNVTLKQTPFGNENTLAAQHVKSLYASENNFLGLTASSENQTERQREV